MVEPKQITEEELARLARNLKTWHQLVISNGYWIPDLNTRACTLKYISQIRP